MTAADKFRKLLDAETSYDPEAYNFVYEALDYTLKNVAKARQRSSHHVTGPELLEGIRRFSIDQFGCLVEPVFESWGVTKTGDFGTIVFNLVDYDLMGKQDSDRLEDFQEVYEFEEVFKLTPVLHYSRERDEWKASYMTKSQRARIGELS